MKPTDDIWKDITTLSSPTTNHFQTFFAPALRPPVTTTDFFPEPIPSTTSTTNLDHDQDPNKRHKPNPPPQQPQQKLQSSPPVTTSPEYSEKFRRLMKNRESASRSRARKQARAGELEQEVMRLAKENAKLKRQQKEVIVSNDPKEARLHRTKSAPF